jgi:hypothetical protein
MHDEHAADAPEESPDANAPDVEEVEFEVANEAGDANEYDQIADVVESVVDVARRGLLAVMDLGDAAYDKLRGHRAD